MSRPSDKRRQKARVRKQRKKLRTSDRPPRNASPNAKLPIFLGVSTRILQHTHGWDIERCTSLLAMPFFPNTLNGAFLVLALPQIQSERMNLSLRRTSPTELAAGYHLDRAKRESGFAEPFDPLALGKVVPSDLSNMTSITQVTFRNSPYHLFPVASPPLTLYEPTEVIVEVEIAGEKSVLGSFWTIFVPPAPLTEEERRGYLRNDSETHETCEMTCNECGDKLLTYLPVDPAVRPRTLSADYIPLHDAPDPWTCQCGTISIPTSYLKVT